MVTVVTFVLYVTCVPVGLLWFWMVLAAVSGDVCNVYSVPR